MGRGSSKIGRAGSGSTGGNTLVDVLATDRGRQLVDSIEESAEEIRGRGIDPFDTSEFWVRSYWSDVQALHDEFGYDYDALGVGRKGK